MAGRFLAIPAALLLLGGCGSGASGGSVTPSPTPQATVSPESPSDGVVLPQPVAVEQGGRYWAVYAVVAEAGSAELDEAFQRLQGLGIEAVSFGELSCDRGAAEALGLPADRHGVAVYFEKRADANAFAASLDPPAAGVARVRTFCAD